MAGIGLFELLIVVGIVIGGGVMLVWIYSWLRPGSRGEPREEQLQVSAGPYRSAGQPLTELDALDADSLTALYGLASLMAGSDGRTTPDELAPLQDVWDHFGPRECQEAMDRADEVLAGRPDPVESLAGMVTRKEGQELLFGKLLEVAFKQHIEREESRLLEQLQSHWRMDVKFEPYR